MIHQLNSINIVISKIVRDLGLGDKEIPWEDFVEWIADGLKHIGSFYQFTEKVTSISIEDYKGELPCDFYKSIRMLSSNDLLINNEHLIGVQETTLQGVKRTDTDLNINHNVITVSFRTGTIDLQYLAMPVDCNGFPMVPDDVSFEDALFWRVVYMLCLRGYEFKNKQLSDLTFVKRKWDFYCIQARANANMPDLDMQERLKNNFLRLKTDPHQYSKGFSTNGSPENLDLNGKN
jgi:hypothetical protein